MIGTKRLRMLGTRKAGIALTGLLVGGLALASGTAFASTSSSASNMSGMSMASSSGHHRGFTKGFYDGHTVHFYYSKNFRCKQPPVSHAFSKCEGGTNYTQTPAESFDPLYVIVPLGFTPPRRTLQCRTGNCIDHPRYIDLSAVLGSGAGNVLLPAHSHIVADRERPPVGVVERGHRRGQEPVGLEPAHPRTRARASCSACSGPTRSR